MIPIFFATDHNFAVPTCVAIASLLRSAPGEAHSLHIMVDNDVTPEDIEMFETQVKVLSPASTLAFTNLGDEFNEAHTNERFSKTTYFRLSIPWLFPQYDKVIYADADLIFNIGLREIYDNFNLSELYVAGVNKPKYQTGHIAKSIKSLHLDPGKYINAGFLLINCALWRRDNLWEKFQPYLKPGFPSFDQRIINLTCQNRIGYLPEYYNLDPAEYVNDPTPNYILHYVDEKPWKTFSWEWECWWDAYRLSACFDKDFYRARRHEIISKVLKLQKENDIYIDPFVLMCSRMSRKFPSLGKLTASVSRLLHSRKNSSGW